MGGVLNLWNYEIPYKSATVRHFRTGIGGLFSFFFSFFISFLSFPSFLVWITGSPFEGSL